MKRTTDITRARLRGLTLAALWCVSLGLVTASGCSQTTPPGTDTPPGTEVSFSPIKLDKLVSYLQAQKGHVVVVDFWATYCPPCEKEFPRFMKICRRHAKDSVVGISVCVDSPKDKETANAFLREQKARIVNFQLEEDANLWLDRFDLVGIPGVLVFQRNGNLAERLDCRDPDHPLDYDEVEQIVTHYLEQ